MRRKRKRKRKRRRKKKKRKRKKRKKKKKKDVLDDVLDCIHVFVSKRSEWKSDNYSTVRTCLASHESVLKSAGESQTSCEP